jgi:hypothetical protein
LEQVRAGITFTFSVPWLWITICIFALVNLGIAGPLIVALPLLVRDVLHADARVYGAIGTVVGIGELCGTFLSGQFPVRHTGVVMYVWAILSGVAVAAIGLVAALPEIFVFAFAQGLSLVGFGILWDTAVQRHVPRDMLGRVSSVDGFGSFLLLPIGPLIFAALVERVGPQGAFVVGGGGAFRGPLPRSPRRPLHPRAGMNRARYRGTVRLSERRDRPVAGLDGGHK